MLNNKKLNKNNIYCKTSLTANFSLILLYDILFRQKTNKFLMLWKKIRKGKEGDDIKATVLLCLGQSMSGWAAAAYDAS